MNGSTWRSAAPFGGEELIARIHGMGKPLVVEAVYRASSSILTQITVATLSGPLVNIGQGVMENFGDGFLLRFGPSDAFPVLSVSGGIAFNITIEGGTTIDTAYATCFAAPGSPSAPQLADVLDQWVHILFILTPDLLSKSMLDGMPRPASCAYGLVASQSVSTPGLPGLACNTTDMKYNYKGKPLGLSRRTNLSAINLRWGDGVVTPTGSDFRDRGSVASMTWYQPADPWAFASALALPMSNTSAARRLMPSIIAGAVLCEGSPVASTGLGRTVCRIQCASRSALPVVSRQALCASGDVAKWLLPGFCSGAHRGDSWMLPALTSVLSSQWSGVLGLSATQMQLARMQQAAGNVSGPGDGLGERPPASTPSVKCEEAMPTFLSDFEDDRRSLVTLCLGGWFDTFYRLSPTTLSTFITATQFAERLERDILSILGYSGSGLVRVPVSALEYTMDESRCEHPLRSAALEAAARHGVARESVVPRGCVCASIVVTTWKDACSSSAPSATRNSWTVLNESTCAESVRLDQTATYLSQQLVATLRDSAALSAVGRFMPAVSPGSVASQPLLHCLVAAPGALVFSSPPPAYSASCPIVLIESMSIAVLSGMAVLAIVLSVLTTYWKQCIPGRGCGLAACADLVCCMCVPPSSPASLAGTTHSRDTPELESEARTSSSSGPPRDAVMPIVNEGEVGLGSVNVTRTGMPETGNVIIDDTTVAVAEVAEGEANEVAGDAIRQPERAERRPRRVRTHRLRAYGTAPGESASSGSRESRGCRQWIVPEAAEPATQARNRLAVGAGIARVVAILALLLGAGVTGEVGIVVTVLTAWGATIVARSLILFGFASRVACCRRLGAAWLYDKVIAGDVVFGTHERKHPMMTTLIMAAAILDLQLFRGLFSGLCGMQGLDAWLKRPLSQVMERVRWLDAVLGAPMWLLVAGCAFVFVQSTQARACLATAPHTPAWRCTWEGQGLMLVGVPAFVSGAASVLTLLFSLGELQSVCAWARARRGGGDG